MGAITSQGAGFRSQEPGVGDEAEAGRRKRGLVLTRKIGQEIVIPLSDGEEICIKPIGYRANGVQIHIAAPSRVTIHRREVLEVILSQKAADQLGITLPEEVLP
jgi:carbon storage regulator CsrA